MGQGGVMQSPREWGKSPLNQNSFTLEQHVIFRRLMGRRVTAGLLDRLPGGVTASPRETRQQWRRSPPQAWRPHPRHAAIQSPLRLNLRGVSNRRVETSRVDRRRGGGLTGSSHHHHRTLRGAFLCRQERKARRDATIEEGAEARHQPRRYGEDAPCSG